MSRVSKRINNIKNKLDSISGLDGDFVFDKLDILDKYIDILIINLMLVVINDYFKGTIFEDYVKEE